MVACLELNADRVWRCDWVLREACLLIVEFGYAMLSDENVTHFLRFFHEFQLLIASFGFASFCGNKVTYFFGYLDEFQKHNAGFGYVAELARRSRTSPFTMSSRSFSLCLCISISDLFGSNAYIPYRVFANI